MTQRPVLLVMALTAVLVLWNLGGYDLGAPDEPYFAEGAREMIVDGQWLVPHVNGVVTTDKPPLFFWLIAVLSWPFGAVSSWTARLPSAVAALGTVALTMRLGLRLSGPRVAALAGVLLATSYMFWDKARSAQIDSLLCLLILVALSAFEAFRAGDLGGRAAGLVFWSACGLAVLAKGPVGLLLPLGIALVTLGFDRKLGRWRRFLPVAGPLLFLALALAWAVTATLGSGGEYSAWGALREHAIERAAKGMHHKQPFWYYLRVLPTHLLPWSGLVLGGLVLAWRRRRDPVDRLLLVWISFVLLFFSLSTEKRDLYVLPAFPAMALLGARLIAAVAGWQAEGGPTPNRRWVTVSQGLVGSVLASAGLVLPWLAPPRLAVEAAAAHGTLLVAVWILAGVLAAGGLAMVWVSLRGRVEAAVLATGVTIAVVYLVIAGQVLPALDPVKSARSFARRVADLTRDYRAEGGSLVAFCLANLPESIAFYGDGLYTVEVLEPGPLLRHLTPGSGRYALVSADYLEQLAPELRATTRVVAETRLSRMDVQLIRAEVYYDDPG